MLLNKCDDVTINNSTIDENCKTFFLKKITQKQQIFHLQVVNKQLLFYVHEYRSTFQFRQSTCEYYNTTTKYITDSLRRKILLLMKLRTRTRTHTRYKQWKIDETNI